MTANVVVATVNRATKPIDMDPIFPQRQSKLYGGKRNFAEKSKPSITTGILSILYSPMKDGFTHVDALTPHLRNVHFSGIIISEIQFVNCSLNNVLHKSGKKINTEQYNQYFSYWFFLACSFPCSRAFSTMHSKQKPCQWLIMFRYAYSFVSFILSYIMWISHNFRSVETGNWGFVVVASRCEWCK